MKLRLMLIAVFMVGILVGFNVRFTSFAQQSDKPAFLIVAADRNASTTAQDYVPYQQAAGPLARAAGLAMVASSQSPELLEGAWPYGNVAIERFDSMAALQEFWYSEGYQQAKQLREGLSKINFIVAVEGD